MNDVMQECMFINVCVFQFDPSLCVLKDSKQKREETNEY